MPSWLGFRPLVTLGRVCSSVESDELRQCCIQVRFVEVLGYALFLGPINRPVMKPCNFLEICYVSNECPRVLLFDGLRRNRASFLGEQLDQLVKFLLGIRAQVVRQSDYEFVLQRLKVVLNS